MIDNSESLGDSWLAVCLFIPTEWLHELPIENFCIEELVDNGKRILSALDEGFYSRIGWSSFFCLVKGNEQETRDIVESEIKSRDSGFSGYYLWRYSIETISDVLPKEIFSELEWRSHEEARSSRCKK